MTERLLPEIPVQVSSLPSGLPRRDGGVVRYRLLGARDLEDMPPIAWRVKLLLPTQGLAQIYGPSKSGKSFLTFDLACAIAEGRDWFGYRVNCAPVVLVALEGEAGYRLRAEAWKAKNGRPLPTNLNFIMQPFRINDDGDVLDLCKVLPRGAVVFIDTQNRAAPDADENSSRDMGRIIDGAKEMQRACDGLVVLIAHTGKDVSKGPRGHSSQIPAVDTAIEVSRNGEARTWRANKVKDGRDGAKHGFKLGVFVVGFDEDGDELTSCAIERDDAEPARTGMHFAETERQAIAAYCRAGEEGDGCTDSAGEYLGLHLEAWREKFYALSTADNVGAKRKAFQRARTKLSQLGVLDVLNDIYRVKTPDVSARECEFIAASMKRDTGHHRDISGTCPAAAVPDHRDGTGHHP